MTPTKQQIPQINSINPDILKLDKELKELNKKMKKLGRAEPIFKIIPNGEKVYILGYLRGELSQCKSELEFLLKRVYEKGKNVKERISALKVTIQFLEGVLK